MAWLEQHNQWHIAKVCSWLYPTFYDLHACGIKNTIIQWRGGGHRWCTHSLLTLFLFNQDFDSRQFLYCFSYRGSSTKANFVSTADCVTWIFVILYVLEICGFSIFYTNKVLARIKWIRVTGIRVSWGSPVFSSETTSIGRSERTFIETWPLSVILIHGI